MNIVQVGGMENGEDKRVVCIGMQIGETFSDAAVKGKQAFDEGYPVVRIGMMTPVQNNETGEVTRVFNPIVDMKAEHFETAAQIQHYVSVKHDRQQRALKAQLS